MPRIPGVKSRTLHPQLWGKTKSGSLADQTLIAKLRLRFPLIVAPMAGGPSFHPLFPKHPEQEHSARWARIGTCSGSRSCIGEKFKTSVADHLQTTFASPSWGSWSARTKVAPASYVDGYRAIPRAGAAQAQDKFLSRERGISGSGRSSTAPCRHSAASEGRSSKGQSAPRDAVVQWLIENQHGPNWRARPSASSRGRHCIGTSNSHRLLIRDNGGDGSTPSPIAAVPLG